ncbi:uncharacterized protein K02A2.6-like [Ischnura elegans]|uniref:uncharacterized protein K02A2.6-like n=1 Tax=Ischnura elegans TaxID=197161 RepID=UPI001ED87493|nr:uncharacterized protein K02A2.6-like [Ischnura elegans]
MKVGLKPTSLILESFNGHKVKPLGVIDLKCRVLKSGKDYVLNFVVVEGNDSKTKPLLGLCGCVELELIHRKWVNIVKCCGRDKFVNDNKDLFSGVGCFPETCSIVLNENSVPVANPPRRVPLALRERLKDKLEKLERDNIIKKVENPQGWVSNLVVIEKGDKTMRLCLDPHDLNKCIKRSYFQIPTLEDISSKLQNKSVFTVLDLKDGFYQVKLDKNASELCTFSSPFGCYQFKRLPFGLKNAPELFQRLNEKNFGDIPGVIVYFDDMLLAAKDEKEHDVILSKVVSRARLLNIKFNAEKIQFKVREVKYLGHIFCKNGMKLDPTRIKAILSIESPRNKLELKRVLGLFGYMRKFIPNMAAITAPLRELLKEMSIWCWLPVHEKVLNDLKSIVTKAPILSNDVKDKPLAIQCDASKDGLGCCLLSENRPVSFASCALTETQKSYSQIEKEFLSVIFATSKFHYYIYGRPVVIYTDHKPLVSIMKMNIAKIGSPRLKRMRIKLLKYDLDVRYLPGKLMYIADPLSRSYCKDDVHEEPCLAELIHVVGVSDQLQMSEKRKMECKAETAVDVSLKRVMNFCEVGWPRRQDLDGELSQYYKIRTNIHEDNGLLFFDNKLIVPTKLRRYMLELLHQGHMGIEKTKARARQVLYWPNINRDIAQYVKQCSVCEKFRSANIKEPMIGHEIPEFPFEKIGMDLMNFAGKTYLVVIDYFSNWIELLLLGSCTADTIVRNLKPLFATHGIPRVITCDNMPFNSIFFRKFANDWGIGLRTSSPLYPKSNGLAERGVQICKMMLRKCNESGDDVHLSLLEYRNTPLSGLGTSPAQLLMSRRLRSKLPVRSKLLKPLIQKDVGNKLRSNQLKNKQYYDRGAVTRQHFQPGDNIVIKNKRVWLPGVGVAKDRTPRSYIIKNHEDRFLRRNSFHLRQSITPIKTNGNNVINSDYKTRSGRIVRKPKRYCD